MKRLATVVLVLSFGCGGKKDPAPETSSGSGSTPAKTGSGTASVTKPDAAPVAGAGSGSATGSATGSGSGAVAGAGSGSGSGSGAPDEPKRPMPAACLPTGFGVRDIAFGRVDGKLVACADDGEELRACWTIDAKGAVTKRDTAPLPGVGFPIKGHCYKDACWDAAKDPDVRTLLALHPDGKRAAVLVDHDVSLLDLPAKKVTAKFTIDIGNQPAKLWFVGDAVYIRGDDAGPAQALNVFALDGKKGKRYPDFYHGGATVSDGALVAQELALTRVRVIEGGKDTAIERKLAKGPCKLDENPEWDAIKDDAGQKKCFDYLVKQFGPYDGAQLVRDGDGFIGFSDAAGAMFTLDKALVEKSRTKVAMCPSAPE